MLQTWASGDNFGFGSGLFLRYSGSVVKKALLKVWYLNKFDTKTIVRHVLLQVGIK